MKHAKGEMDRHTYDKTKHKNEIKVHSRPTA
jgi:hypothetical protein